MYMEPSTLEIYETALHDLNRQLAGIEEDRQRILRARDSIKEYLESHRPKATTVSVTVTKYPPDYSGLTLIGAVKRFLEHAGTPKSFGEIEAGLKGGGYPTTSKNLVGMIRPVVYKAERKGNGSDDSIIKIDGRWGLKAWRKNESQKNQGPILFPARDTESALVEEL